MNIVTALKNYTVDVATQTGSVIVAGSLRRSRLPTLSLCAFGLVQAVVSTTAMKGIEWTERKLGWNPDSEKISRANYVISQVISIALTYFAIQSLAAVGLTLLYDMNLPSLSRFDGGSIFCIVAQSTLVTLAIQSIRDLAQWVQQIRHTSPVQDSIV